jgi:hypothetical protein
MSSVWTQIDEKALSTTIIKNENPDVDEENSSLSNVSGTTSSSTNSRISARNSSQQNEQQQQQNQQGTIYSEQPSSSTITVTNINTVSSNDLQQEQYPSTNGKT